MSQRTVSICVGLVFLAIGFFIPWCPWIITAAVEWEPTWPNVLIAVCAMIAVGTTALVNSLQMIFLACELFDWAISHKEEPR